jgi:hypothetical protein
MAGQSDGAPQPATLHVSSGLRIARLVSGGQSQEAGEVTLPCSARGQTPSYAVLLAGSEGGQQWVVVAGLSGKAVTANNAREVEAIFESLSGGDDAP